MINQIQMKYYLSIMMLLTEFAAGLMSLQSSLYYI